MGAFVALESSFIFKLDLTARFSFSLLKEPNDYLPAFDHALKEVVLSVHDPSKHAQVKDAAFYVGLKGSLGDHHVNPRTLRAAMLGKMISIEGIVTRCAYHLLRTSLFLILKCFVFIYSGNLVRPKIMKSVHFCPETTRFHTREYRDVLASGPEPPSSTVYPKEDAEGHKLETEYGLSTYMDHQKVMIQEMPERAPAGQLPRSVEVVMDDDLVDRVKPGDRVQIVGIYRSIGGGSGGSAFK